MSSSVKEKSKVVKLNFTKWADDMKQLASYSDRTPEAEIKDKAASWAAAHAGDANVVQIIVPNGHPYWTDKVRDLIERRLKGNNRGVTLEVVPA